MKKFILNFKQTIRFIVAIIVSREFAFIYCVLGTVAQVSHTYFLTNSISSLTGGWRTTQAVMLSIFISSSLLYFTAIADNADTKESKKVHFAVTMFTIIEILINIYYYSRHLIIDQPDYQVFDFVFAILISCLIPVTIKLYSSHIRAKEWVIDIEHDKQAFVSEDIKNFSVDTEKHIFDPSNFQEEPIIPTDPDYEINDNDFINHDELNEIVKPAEDLILLAEPFSDETSTYNESQSEDKISKFIETFTKKHEAEIEGLRKEIEDLSNPENNQKLNAWFEEKTKTFNSEMVESFSKNRDLFLQQFENKAKLLMKQKAEEIK